MNAAEQFVVFQTAADVLPLQDAGISFDAKEHSCVQRAVANLKLDFERVTGHMPSEGRAGILVGTVGVNKQIDQWVKKGEHVSSTFGVRSSKGHAVKATGA